MSIPVKSNMQLNQWQLLNARLHQNAGAPTSPTPVSGQVYYDTGTSKAYYYNGSAWVDMTGGAVSAYTNFTDGTTTATAGSASDTFKFRTANNAISLAVQNNDATHGDNLLMTFNVGNVDHNSLANTATGDVHTQYVHISTARTISATHTWNGSQTFNAGFAATGTINFTNTTGTAPFAVGSTTVVTNFNADRHDGFDASQTPTANTVAVSGSGGKLAAGWIQEVIALADLTDVTATTGSGTTAVLSSSPSLTLPTFVAAGGVSADAGSGRVINVATPSASTDAANKSYVDAAIQGLTIRTPAKVATTGNVTLSGGAPSTVDGVTVAVNDRILVKSQTTSSQNGIYIVQTLGTGANGTWVRATDADAASELFAGVYIFVDQGTVNSDTGWTLTASVTTLGTDPVTFAQFNGAGSNTASNVNSAGVGVFKQRTGNNLEFKGIKANSTKVAIVDSTSDNTVSVDVNEANLTLSNIGGTLGITQGGTGATSVSGAKTNLGFVGRYAATIGDGTSSSYAVTHNLGTTDVQVQVFDASTNELVLCDVVRTSSTVVTITFGGAVAANSYRVVVVG